MADKTKKADPAVCRKITKVARRTGGFAFGGASFSEARAHLGRLAGTPELRGTGLDTIERGVQHLVLNGVLVDTGKHTVRYAK